MDEAVPLFFLFGQESAEISAYQYARPQYTIFLAGLPQQTHLSESCSWSKGMQREVAPVSSLILSSHSWQPHHMAFTKPGFSLMVSSNSAKVVAVWVWASRWAYAFSNR